MPDDERSPLLRREDEDASVSENAPLLADNSPQPSEGEDHNDSPAQTSGWSFWPRSSSSDSSGEDGPRKRRWPSIIAITTLALLVVVVLLIGFLAPGAVKQYAEHAAVIEPTALSVESITADGVRARIQANFILDGSRVSDNNARRIGRIATGIMKKLETEETTVSVYLPTYDNRLLGTAVIPPITIDITDGHKNTVDIVTILSPGDAESIRSIANDWLEGRLDQLKVTGSADLSIKSGIFPLGTHSVKESLVFEADEVPTIPEYKFEKLSFHDVPLGHKGRKAVGANVTLTMENPYSISGDVPPLGFEILVPNCDASLPYIAVAEAVTEVIHVQSKGNISAGAMGLVREIPEPLVQTCPKSQLSPLDHFMEHYLHGEDAEIFVRGKYMKDSATPKWISEILESIIVPLEFPGRSFGDRIRNFSISDVDFKLPSPFADPDDPDAVPRISGNMLVLAALPEELNLDLGVNSIKANADLFYEGDKLGELALKEWHKAKSTKIIGDAEDLLNITSRVVDVPLHITNGSVFSDVMQKMLFGDEDIFLDVDATVDAKVGTVLGNLALKGVPAKGKIPVKGLPKNTISKLEPLVDDIRILNTSETGVTMRARVNFTNPTPYTATIPFLNVHILNNDIILGEAIATDVTLSLGNNTGNIIQATWDPYRFGGQTSQDAARRLLSDYLSGKNTTLQIQTHRGSVPTVPIIGDALKNLNLTMPTPRLKLPDDDNEDGQVGVHFIREATFHLFSSSASFTLASPLHYNTVYIQKINATAFYNHTEPIGEIITDDGFAAPPGLSITPRLPVMWSPDRIGYDKLRAALGGNLKLDAVANVTIRVGNWVEEIHYEGRGIGAKVRI